MDIKQDWFKSSDSTGANNCLEARIHTNGTVDVRNSKTPEDGMVSFTPGEWTAFLSGAKRGEFDLA